MKQKPLKVIARVEEEYREPDYIAHFRCPHCHHKLNEEVYDENCTVSTTCHKCEKVFKVKIPKFL